MWAKNQPHQIFMDKDFKLPISTYIKKKCWVYVLNSGFIGLVHWDSQGPVQVQGHFGNCTRDILGLKKDEIIYMMYFVALDYEKSQDVNWYSLVVDVGTLPNHKSSVSLMWLVYRSQVLYFCTNAQNKNGAFQTSK